VVTSVLENVTRHEVRVEPYPHVVVENCLPEQYFNELAAAYPSDETIIEFCRQHPYRTFPFADGAGRQNARYDISAFQALESPEGIPEIWLDFVRYHTSPEFFAEVAKVFGPVIRQAFPFLEDALGRPVEEFTTGVRFRSERDISLDCQIGINTPATRPSSVRRVHTDAPVELFAILLYFRMSDDDATGGDLEIFRWKDPRRKIFFGSEADESAAERVDTVRYRPNTMVMFLNSQDSLHAVTPRGPSAHTRRLVNIIGEVDCSYPQGLFLLPKSKRTDIAYLRRKLSGLGRRIRGA
jgi:hypothetical protein